MSTTTTDQTTERFAAYLRSRAGGQGVDLSPLLDEDQVRGEDVVYTDQLPALASALGFSKPSELLSDYEQQLG